MGQKFDCIMYKNNINGVEVWLKERDLVVGKVYLIKDGRLMLYLGRSTNGNYIFYAMASAYLKYNSAIVTFGNYDNQVAGLIQIIENSMKDIGRADCILQYKGLPKIHGEFPFVDYEKSYKKWYLVSFSEMFSGGKDVPNLISITNGKIKTPFVKSKDLIPGHIYYSDKCWRSTYVYLGRNSRNEYIWVFIWSERQLIKASIQDLLSRAQITKQNKKVKPLSEALNDKNAHVDSDTRELIRWNYSVDVSKLTQQQLDSVYNASDKLIY